MTEAVGDDGLHGPDVDLVTLSAGQVIGRYRILEVLGQGGFGITYRAVDAELGRHVAIKEYLPTALAVRKDGVTVVPRSRSAAEDLAWGLERFVAEGRTLAALHRAPGIVKVHDYLRANGTAYLVMELVEGETLHDRITRRGPLDADAIATFLEPLLEGLEKVHAAGFLHRDIKPANILLDLSGRPILIDFGASRAAIAGRTLAMTAVFTPGYAPVEQFTSATQGAFTDIYSLAATLYHAIAGAPTPNAIDRMLHDALAPLASSGRPFPRSLLEGIDAALALRAADRPQDVAAWRAILNGGASPADTVVMQARVTPMSAPTTGTPLRSDAGAHRHVVTITAAIAFLLVAAGGWFALNGNTPGVPSAPQASTTDPVPMSASATTAAQDRALEELERARREQRAAQEEASRLRADAEARRKADEEAALRVRIEREVREQAAAEHAKREADAQTAAKAKSDAEAAAKVQEEATARLRVDDNARQTTLKAAEAGEASLRLGQTERQRVQVALTSLGFATGGTDGVFGVRSREMIAAWQANAGRPATGYISQDQHAALLRDAAPALARFDEEQKKLVQASPASPATTASPPAAASPAGKGQCEGTFRSQWCRAAYQGFPPSCWNANMTIRNGEVSDSWASQSDATRRNVVNGRIDAAGNVSLTFDGVGQQTHVNQRFVAQMQGKVTNGVLTAAGRAGAGGRDFTVNVRCQ